MNKKQADDISRFLSLVLRHQPEKIGLTLDGEGWVDNGVWLTDAVPAQYIKYE